MENKLKFDIEADEIEIFLQDLNEHLQVMETGILHLERSTDPDTLNATFRAAHTLKAVAATIGHHQMAELTHTLETLFDAMREGQLSPTQAVTDQLLAAVDVLRALRDEVVTQEPSEADANASLARLRALMEQAVEPGEDMRSSGRGGAPPDASPLNPPQGGNGQHHLASEQAAQVREYQEQGRTVLEIEVTACADAFAPGARLLQAAMTLEEIGQVIVQCPSQEDLSQDLHDGSLWLVLAIQSDEADTNHAADTTPESEVKHILGGISDLAEFQVKPYATDIPATTSMPAETQPVVTPGESPTTDNTVRISVERLDALMNLVGELVTDRTRLAQIEDSLRAQYGKDAAHRNDGSINAMSEMTVHFGRVVDQLQEEVMQARMLPIARLFGKFPRLVRDLARAAGKQVNLVIEGEATELDRSIIEVIGDPLIHLIRNAVDHGIESPQERMAAGKPPTGTVWLSAAHEEGHIVISVKDNGRGITPERIRRAAVRQNILSEDEATQLDDEAAISLIFQPNLSTAERVTDVSGRGVGLDVVRTNVKQLSGSVVVESEVGHGTTFRITLPLTLAIVQAMLISVGDDSYAIPLTGIVESLYLSDVAVSSVKGKPVVRWRDRVLPLLHLREFFATPHLSSSPLNHDKQAIVIVSWGKLQVGLIVDDLIGKQEIVVKSLSPLLGNVPGISGCTILGDGRIALIIDISGLVSACLQAQRQEATT